MKNIFNNHIKIDHPLANKISVQNSEYHHCTPGKSSEIAFFLNNKFQTEIIEEFSDYADGLEGDTLVYSFVPDDLIDEFIELFGVY